MAESVENTPKANRAPGIRMNRRTRLVEYAGTALRSCMAEIIRKYELTDAEIQVILNKEAATWLKYALRHERHPGETGKGADEE